MLYAMISNCRQCCQVVCNVVKLSTALSLVQLSAMLSGCLQCCQVVCSVVKLSTILLSCLQRCQAFCNVIKLSTMLSIKLLPASNHFEVPASGHIVASTHLRSAQERVASSSRLVTD